MSCLALALFVWSDRCRVWRASCLFGAASVVLGAAPVRLGLSLSCLAVACLPGDACFVLVPASLPPSWATPGLFFCFPGSRGCSWVSLLVAPGSLGDSCVVPELHWVSVILALPAGQQQTRRASRPNQASSRPAGGQQQGNHRQKQEQANSRPAAGQEQASSSRAAGGQPQAEAGAGQQQASSIPGTDSSRPAPGKPSTTSRKHKKTTKKLEMSLAISTSGQTLAFSSFSVKVKTALVKHKKTAKFRDGLSHFDIWAKNGFFQLFSKSQNGACKTQENSKISRRSEPF